MQSQPMQPHWSSHALNWRYIGPPLRPCAEDVQELQRRLVARLPENAGAGLLLGVTPEIARANWPFSLTAVDLSQAMIDHVWPGDGPGRRALRGDWLELPVAEGSMDVAIGDGCFSIFDVPAGYERFSASIARALRPQGLFAIRLYARLSPGESVEQVFDDLFARKIGSIHAFKWRLAMALQGESPSESVKLAEIWDTYAARVPDPSALAAHTGFPIEEVSTLNAYRGSPSAYSFPKLETVLELIAPWFEPLEVWHGSYELAERCPQLLLRKR